MDKEITVKFDKDSYKEYRKLQEVVVKGKAAKRKPTYSQLLSSINTSLRKLKQTLIMEI